MSLNWAARILLLCVLLALAGCGSGSGGEDPVDDPGTDDPTDPGDDDPPVESLLNVVSPSQSAAYYAFLLDDFAQVFDASKAGGATDFTTLPATGSVDYSGYMQLILGNQSVSANVIGEATLTHDLQNSAVSGQADEFLGVAEDEFGFDQVASYDGTILLTGGIAGAGGSGTNVVTIDIEGTLDNGLNTFGVTGDLTGAFYGNGAEGLHMIGSNTGVHGNVDTLIDGIASSLTIGIATVSVTSE